MLFGKNYFINNPEYLVKSIKDKNNCIKASRCVNENIYNLDFTKKPFNVLRKKNK
jgi:hypothetical protein